MTEAIDYEALGRQHGEENGKRAAKAKARKKLH